MLPCHPARIFMILTANTVCLQLKKWFKQRGSGDEIKRVVLSAQKGTRVVQTICAEAKAQRMGSVARLVPSTKKNLEKFVQFVRVILQESTAGRFWVGQLKHKNLRGQCCHSAPSQALTAPNTRASSAQCMPYKGKLCCYR